MPDTLLISAGEFSANFDRYEAEASRADLVKVVRDGQVVGGYLSARELAHYEQLKRREAEVLRVGELPPDVVADIEAAEYGSSRGEPSASAHRSCHPLRVSLEP